MSMRGRRWSNRPLGLLAGGLLGAGAALLASCGGSGKLIPVANSEPLQKDFEEVARAAENGHGSCSATEAALAKTKQDFAALPASVDAGLRRRLREGISKLHTNALELCIQPAVSTTPTTAPRTNTSTPTGVTPTNTQTSSTQTSTQTTPNTTTTTAPGGGTPAKEGEGEEEASPGRHKGNGKDGEGAPSGGAAPGGEAAK